MLGHGYYTLSVQENLLISHFFGAWNVEQTQNYANHTKSAATVLTNKPWARIVDLTLWEGGGIDVVSPLQTLQQWAEKNNCQHVIFINPPLIPQYMLDKYGDPYGSYKISNSVEEATSWAKSALADT